jgi:hypothetical protein
MWLPINQLTGSIKLRGLEKVVCIQLLFRGADRG